MASPLETPSRKEAPPDADESGLQDRSDGDESDDKQDAEKDSGSPLATDEKAHDTDANYTEELNTNYSLFSNPPTLAAVRQLLFEVSHEIEMSAKDFEVYFPFVDNVWRKYRNTESQTETEGASETFCCRLKPTGQQKTPTPKPHVQGKQQRRKRKREDKTCSMLIKVTYVEHPVKKVKITRAAGSDAAHTHDLDYMDQNKRNSAIMDVARREAVRAFLPGSIFWKMQEEPEKMEAAGGKFMKVSDVRNVQYPWRQQNMNAQLKAHSGYSQQRSGPRHRPAGSAPATPRNGDVRPHRPAPTFSPHPPPPAQPAPPPPAQPAPLPPRPQLAPPPLPPGTLNYPEHAKDFLRPYLPYVPHLNTLPRPHITLTWATSLDSRIALQPGVQTVLSGPETKAMTHFLRSQHDAILVGVNTAIADDPGLNCRLVGAGGFGGTGRVMQPRPIIIDPRARLNVHPNMRLLRAAAEGKAQGPWIVVGPGVRLGQDAVTTLKRHGGEYLQVNEIQQHGLDWPHLFQILHREGIQSIMIEGGGKVLSELLHPRYTNMVDSVIITITPTFLGQNGVQVSPETSYDGPNAIQTRLNDIRWQPMGQSDMVLCAHLNKSQPRLPGIEHFSQQAAPPPPPTTHPPPPPVPAAQPPLQGHPSQASPPPAHPPPAQPPLGQPQAQGHLPPPDQSSSSHVNGAGAPASNKTTQFRHYGPPALPAPPAPPRQA